MKILIVDDDQLTATTWSMGLKSAGFDVVTAVNGQDGINQAKSQKPDLVLLDQIMPDMLGNAVLATLKQDPDTSQIPVMLISNYNEAQMMKEAIEKGAVDYILKYQIETKDLVDKIRTVLAEVNTGETSAAPTSPAAATPTQEPQTPSSNETPLVQPTTTTPTTETSEPKDNTG
jgi:CheY-like chemotaxis protein